jgi:hypothetical protein
MGNSTMTDFETPEDDKEKMKAALKDMGGSSAQRTRSQTSVTPWLERRKLAKELAKYESLANERESDAEKDGMLFVIERLRTEFDLGDY